MLELAEANGGASRALLTLRPLNLDSILGEGDAESA
jgi:hypothetical protein